MEDADDLVLLAADKQMAETLRGILSRPEALGTREISYTVNVHVKRDPGCRTDAHNFLRSFQADFDHALVLFDYEGCGASGSSSPREVESEVEDRLRKTGWENRARCVVIDPELEVWVWSGSPEVDRCLGWDPSRQRVRDWLRAQNRWPAEAPKPPAPKAAVEEVLEAVHQPWSSSLFRELAETVSLERCEDESFQRFRRILQEWFPPSWRQ